MAVEHRNFEDRSYFAQAASTNSGRLHIIPVRTGWSIFKEGAKRALKTLDSVHEAIAVAKNSHWPTNKIILHQRNGEVIRVDK